MQFEDLDRKIREAADQHHPAYDEKAWLKMEKLLNQHLPQEKDGKRRVIFFLLLLFLIGGGSFLLVLQPWNEKTNLASQPNIDKKASIETGRETTGKKDVRQSETQGVDGVHDQNIPAGKSKTGETITTIAAGEGAAPFKNDRNNVGRRTESGHDERMSNKPVSPTVRESVTMPENDKNKPALQENKTKVEPVAEEKLDDKKSNTEDLRKTKEEIKDQIGAVNQDATQAEQKKPSKKYPGRQTNNGFSFSISVGPDVSKAGSSRTGKTTLVYGAGVGYTRNRFTLRTGLYAAKKIYWANANEYKLSYNPSTSVKFQGADANCDVLEIPLKLSYNFGIKDRGNWFASAGLSSYLMKKEKYVYLFKTSTSTYPYHWQTKNENKHYFSVLDLSGGYSYQLNKTLSISAEPYVEIPLTGIGEGKVHLKSGGILFTIGVRPFKR